MNQLTDVTVRVNDVVFPYIPNSLKVKTGIAVVKFQPLVAAGVIDVISTPDYSTAMGGVSFDMKTTDFAYEQEQALDESKGANTIVLSSQSNEWTLVLEKQSLGPVREFDHAAEGVVSFEFMGNPAKVS